MGDSLSICCPDLKGLCFLKGSFQRYSRRCLNQYLLYYMNSGCVSAFNYRHIHCSCSTVTHIAMYTSIQTCLHTFSTIPICHYFLPFTCIIRSSTCVCTIAIICNIPCISAANFRQSHKHCPHYIMTMLMINSLYSLQNSCQCRDYK